MKRLLTCLLICLVSSLTACGGEEATEDATVDTMVPVGIDSYVQDKTGQAVCIGIDPTAGINEDHHAMCVAWGVTDCTDTGTYCEELFRTDPNNSGCCCETCGIQNGEPTCFFLVCP